MTDSNTAILAAQTAVQDLADTLGQRDAALAAANVQLQLTSDALTEARAQVASLGAANVALQASVDALKAQVAALLAQAATSNTVTAAVTAGALANSAIDAASAKAQPGQTVKVPAGNYLLDATLTPVLKGGVNYDFTGAVFTIQPNSAPRYAGFRTGGSGGSIKGGEVIGDRLKHTYTSGSTHEWGYGVSLAHDNWAVDGMTCRQMTGDGFGITGNNVKLSKCIGTQCRRQGASVFGSFGFRAEDCEFSHTGAYLTDPAAPYGPCAGIDFEPDAIDPTIKDAKLSRCRIFANRANVLAQLRSEVAGTIEIALEDCVLDDLSQPVGYIAGPNGVWACDAAKRAGSIRVSLLRNKFGRHSGNAVKADAGSVVAVGDGTQANANSFQRGSVLRQGIATKYDIAQINGGQANAGWNAFPA